MACRDDGGRFTTGEMDGHPWQIRARQAGLSQKALGRLAGKPDNTISRQLRGEFGPVPLYLIAIITAWEMLDADQRTAWERAIAEAKP